MSTHSSVSTVDIIGGDGLDSCSLASLVRAGSTASLLEHRQKCAVMNRIAGRAARIAHSFLLVEKKKHKYEDFKAFCSIGAYLTVYSQ